MAHKYRRLPDRSLSKTLITVADLPGLTVQLGEMIAIPGKKPRSYRAARPLGADNKPLRPPIALVRKKRGA